MAYVLATGFGPAVLTCDSVEVFGCIRRARGWRMLAAPYDQVCVDEAHCLSEWSHNFRPSYLHIRDIVTQVLRAPAVLALTATATPKSVPSLLSLLKGVFPDGYCDQWMAVLPVLVVTCSTVRDISRALGIPNDGILCLPPSRPNLALSVLHKRGASDVDVVSFLRTPALKGAKSVVVYVTMQV